MASYRAAPGDRVTGSKTEHSRSTRNPATPRRSRPARPDSDASTALPPISVMATSLDSPADSYTMIVNYARGPLAGLGSDPLR
jgi:hypothetical protein